MSLTVRTTEGQEEVDLHGKCPLGDNHAIAKHGGNHMGVVHKIPGTNLIQLYMVLQTEGTLRLHSETFYTFTDDLEFFEEGRLVGVVIDDGNRLRFSNPNARKFTTLRSEESAGVASLILFIETFTDFEALADAAGDDIAVTAFENYQCCLSKINNDILVNSDAYLSVESASNAKLPGKHHTYNSTSKPFVRYEGLESDIIDSLEDIIPSESRTLPDSESESETNSVISLHFLAVNYEILSNPEEEGAPAVIGEQEQAGLLDRLQQLAAAESSSEEEVEGGDLNLIMDYLHHREQLQRQDENQPNQNEILNNPEEVGNEILNNPEEANQNEILNNPEEVVQNEILNNPEEAENVGVEEENNADQVLQAYPDEYPRPAVPPPNADRFGVRVNAIVGDGPQVLINAENRGRLVAGIFGQLGASFRPDMYAFEAGDDLHRIAAENWNEGERFAVSNAIRFTPNCRLEHLGRFIPARRLDAWLGQRLVGNQMVEILLPANFGGMIVGRNGANMKIFRVKI